MKRRVLIALFVVAAVAAVAGWKLGWFGSSPSSVFRDSLYNANAGRYREATLNLSTGDRKQFFDNPKLMEEIWDKISKNRTIAAVATSEEDRGVNGKFGTMKVEITYQDGSKLTETVVISYLNGKWTHGIERLFDAIQDEERRVLFDSYTVSLPKDHTPVPGTKVALRVPDGCVWDADRREFDHPKYGILIRIESSPRSSFASEVEKAEKDWGLPNNSFSKRRYILDEKIKSLLFEGNSKNSQGKAWRLMHLAIGDETEAVLISALVPTQENFIGAVRECLTSARWGR